VSSAAQPLTLLQTVSCPVQPQTLPYTVSQHLQDQALTEHLTVYSVVLDQHVTSTVFRRIIALLLFIVHVALHDV